MVWLIFVSIGAIASGSFAWFEHKARKALRETNAEYWWHSRKEDRDEILERAPEGVRRKRLRPKNPKEDLWTYAHVVKDYIDDECGLPHRGVPWAKPFLKDKRQAKRSRFPLPRSLVTPRVGGGNTYFSGSHSVVNESTWSSIVVTSFWWSVDRGGLIHRGAKLPLAKDAPPLSVSVLACNTDVRIPDGELRQHVLGQGPVVTCLHCFRLKML